MARSIKKGPFVDDHLMEKAEAQGGNEKKQAIKTWSHRSTIFPNLIGHTFAAYGGRRHTPIYVTEDVIDHKLDEFVPTCTFKGHAAGDKKAGG